MIFRCARERRCLIQQNPLIIVVMNEHTSSTSVVLFSWLFATAINSRVQCAFDAINQVGIIAGSSIFDLDDRAGLLVDLLSEGRLSHLGGHARSFNSLSTSVRHSLILDFFVLIHAKVVISYGARMVLNIWLLLSGGCATTSTSTVGSWTSISSLGPDSTGHKH